MKNNSILLLKTLMLSTSRGNIVKYSTDKKKKSKAIGGYIGLFFIYLMIIGYCVAASIGFGYLGLADSVPALSGILVSTLAFVFTVFKTNGYLFNFKEYDMLMSLPFKSSTVAGCKFLYMYIKTLPWYLSASLSMMVGYGLYKRPVFTEYLVWIVLSFVLPIIPMLGAAFVGFIIARISSGFKKTNLVQTILMFVFVIFGFSLRYIIQAMFENDKVDATIENIADITQNTGNTYLPVGWFSDAIVKHSILAFVLLIALTAALFSIVFYLIGRSYRNINSALKSHAAGKRYKMTAQKTKSVINTIAFKELKRMTGSTPYIVNCGMGQVLVVILGFLTMIIGFDKIVGIVVQGAPVDPAILQPAIPFLNYFLVGMLASTACSPSLEGKNYWIMQSLPITKETLYKGKMAFNMYITVPFMTFGILCMCMSARVPFIETLLYLVLGFALCCFSTAWGCVCGIRFMKLDWENEIEVIKQGMNVTIYLLPNMFVVMILCVVVVLLGIFMDHRLLTLIFIAIASLLAFLSYRRVIKLAHL